MLFKYIVRHYNTTQSVVASTTQADIHIARCTPNLVRVDLVDMSRAPHFLQLVPRDG